MGLRTWLGLKKPARRERNPVDNINLRAAPWLTDDSIDAIEVFIAGRAGVRRILEIGAGSSTPWFAERAEYLLSIEHESAWHKRMVGELEARGLSADIRHVARPYFYFLESLPASSFDLILIDGRDRVECLRRGRRLLKADGLLIVDDTERIGSEEKPGRYFEMLELLRGWSLDHYWQNGQDRSGWIPPYRRCTTICRPPSRSDSTRRL